VFVISIVLHDVFNVFVFMINFVKPLGGKMARRPGHPTNGKQYVGNTNSMEVHDLDNEDTNPNGCQINEIIAAGHAVTFSPDTLVQAKSEGYDPGANCLSGSQR